MATKLELEDAVKNGAAGNGSGHSVQGGAPVTLADADVQEIYAELLKRIGTWW